MIIIYKTQEERHHHCRLLRCIVSSASCTRAHNYIAAVAEMKNGHEPARTRARPRLQRYFTIVQTLYYTCIYYYYYYS